MNATQEVLKLKKQVDDLQASIHRAKGARDEALKNLQEEFEVSSLADAKQLLKQLTQESAEAQVEFETVLRAYEEKCEKQYAPK